MAQLKAWSLWLPHWRKAKAVNIEVIDTTVKSGLSFLAPTWEMVRSIQQSRQGLLDPKVAETQYTQQYTELMRQSWRNNREAWVGLLRYEQIALGCYCAPGEFCHRHLLMDFLKAVAQKEGVVFINKGEFYVPPKAGE